MSNPGSFFFYFAVAIVIEAHAPPLPNLYVFQAPYTALHKALAAAGWSLQVETPRAETAKKKKKKRRMQNYCCQNLRADVIWK